MRITSKKSNIFRKLESELNKYIHISAEKSIIKVRSKSIETHSRFGHYFLNTSAIFVIFSLFDRIGGALHYKGTFF